MNNTRLFEFLCLVFPMVSAFLCATLCFRYALSRRRSEASRRHALTMAFTLVAATGCWLGTILVHTDGHFYVRINSLFLLVLMLDQVLLYRFVFAITGTGKPERFNRLHFIVPAAITLLAAVASLLIPFDVQQAALEGRAADSGFRFTELLVFAGYPVFFIYNLLYAGLGFRRVARYRRVVTDYSADTGHASLGWLYLFMALVLSSLPLPVSIVLLESSDGMSLLWIGLTLLVLLLPVVQYTLITYNMIAGNYVVIEPEKQQETYARPRVAVLERRKFEYYIRTRKPYLNPKLRITDMVQELNTNRTYLSSFINSEYGMNFSRYINCQRMAELDRIRTLPRLPHKLGVEMVLEAGFSSYGSYLRVKNEEDRRRVVKGFE